MLTIEYNAHDLKLNYDDLRFCNYYAHQLFLVFGHTILSHIFIFEYALSLYLTETQGMYWEIIRKTLNDGRKDQD